MATTTTHSLRLKFKDTNEEDLTMTYAHAKESVQSSSVRALMNNMITNNAIWQKNPNTIVSAALITRSVKDINVSD